MYITSILALTAITIYTLYTYQKASGEWSKERKDLYDRIMSKDLKEYKEQTAEPVVYEPVDHSEEAEWYREQKELRGE